MMRTFPIAAFVAAAFLLAACAGGAISLPTIATDADNIATGLAAAAKDLRDAKMLTAAQLVQVDDAVSTVQAASAAVATATSAAAAQPEVEQLATAVNAMVAALSEVPTLPAPVPEILAAANVMLPVLESAVGLPAPAAASASAMTPDAAARVLAKQAAIFRAGH